MALKPSLGTPGSSIPTSHYYGPNGDAPPKYEGNPGRASSGVTFAPSFVFNNKSSAQTWNDLMQHTVHVTQMGDYYLINSSNKVIAIPIASDWERFGPNIAANMDDIGENIAGWRKATEESHAISYGESPAFQIFIAERHEHLADPVLNKYVTDIGYAGPLGDLGKYLSKTENLRQSWKRYLASKEGQELAKEMSGDESRVQYMGITPEEATYSVRKLPNGKVLLAAGDQHYDALVGLSKIAGSPITGISLEDIIFRGLGEEAAHVYRHDVDKEIHTFKQLVEIERGVKIDLWNFYNELAENSKSNPGLQHKYERVAKLLEAEIAMVEESYRKSWESSEGNLQSKSLEAALVAEAYANGMETKQEVRAYIATKVAEAKGKEGKGASGASEGNSYIASSENPIRDEEQKTSPASDGETARGGEPASQGSESNSSPESGESAPSSE